MHTRLRLASCVLLVLIVSAARPAAAQDTGTISGTVVDASDQLVPGATVTLVDESTKTARTLVSDERGEFAFRAVLPGTYTVKVELAGFRTYERQHNVLNAASQLTLGQVKLLVGDLTEVVSVVAQGTQVETQNSNYTGLLTSTQIAEIQTKGRDVVSLLRLLPGVRYEDDIEAMGESFGSQMPNVAGQRRHWNQITVDGLNGNEMSGTNRLASATNIDAISEVKVLIGAYKAEDGRSGGANVKVVTKSGGMKYAGSLYYFARRDAWNANRWENNQLGVGKPVYHYDTYGFNLGGPVKLPGVLPQSGEKKLFFFYSMEAPQAQQPGDLRKFMMPTALERTGDFSQTLDAAGKLIVIKDPLTGKPFPNNVVPADRIDPNGQALLKMLPLPNQLDRSITAGIYNFTRQETPKKPRWNHVLRADYKGTTNDTLYLTYNYFTSKQTGSEITVGPERWGFFNQIYDFGNQFAAIGHNHVFRSNLVNEMYGGLRMQTEGFQAASDADWDRLKRSSVGFNVGQVHPELNPLGLLPQVRLGFNTSGVRETRFQYDQRLGETNHDWLMSASDNLTWLKGRHTFKFGFYVEYMRNNEARGGNWTGSFDFRRSSNNPLDTNYSFSNLLLGVFQSYAETDSYRSTRNRHIQVEWYAQDSWRPNARLTVDYGVRFLWYTPYWQADGRTAAFVPERYDPAKAPRLYQPAVINGKKAAYDPVTKQTLNEIYVGTFVPGSGDFANGMVRGDDPSYPRGFRDQLPPQPEPRVGLAYDLRGNGKTKLHASAGLFHNAVLGGGSQGNLQGPPFYNESNVYYSTLSAFLGANAVALQSPSGVNGLERDSATPSAIRYSAGVERDLGWGTVVDVSYVGSVNRHLEMQTNINEVPQGAKFLDLHPENVDPRNGKAKSDVFLRPYIGYDNINIRGNWGTANYHSFQVQLNRRYIKGLQVSAAYTWARAYGIGDDDPASVSLSRSIGQYYAPITGSQTHNLVLSYTYNIPDVTKGSSSRPLRLLAQGWQLSGENAWVSGDWDNVTMSTTDSYDFTGGTEGARPNMTGNPELSRGARDATTAWFDTSVFSRPMTRGDMGNEPRNVLRLPGINNWNLSLYKNFGLGGPRRLQFRVEAYNVLNTTQFRSVDTGAKFDAAGNQVNANFGKATSARNPRIMQLSLRFTF